MLPFRSHVTHGHPSAGRAHEAPELIRHLGGVSPHSHHPAEVRSVTGTAHVRPEHPAFGETEVGIGLERAA